MFCVLYLYFVVFLLLCASNVRSVYCVVLFTSNVSCLCQRVVCVCTHVQITPPIHDIRLDSSH